MFERVKIIMIHRPWDRTRAYPGRNNGGLFGKIILLLPSYVMILLLLRRYIILFNYLIITFASCLRNI